jgi:hypothetical protein
MNTKSFTHTYEGLSIHICKKRTKWFNIYIYIYAFIRKAKKVNIHIYIYIYIYIDMEGNI